MINFIILAVSGTAIIYLVTRVIVIYNTTDGTKWKRVLATAQQSTTILWNGLVIGVAALFNFGMELAGTLGASQEVREAVTSWFDARVASVVIAAIAVVSIIARLRTLGR
jgi:hypothetical protein